MLEESGAAINDHVFATEEDEPAIGPGVTKYLITVDDDIKQSYLTVRRKLLVDLGTCAS